MQPANQKAFITSRKSMTSSAPFSKRIYIFACKQMENQPKLQLINEFCPFSHAAVTVTYPETKCDMWMTSWRPYTVKPSPTLKTSIYLHFVVKRCILHLDTKNS